MTDAELAALKKEHDEKEAALQAKADKAEEARKKAEARSENAQKVIEDHRTRMSEDAEYKKASEKKMKYTNVGTASEEFIMAPKK